MAAESMDYEAGVTIIPTDWTTKLGRSDTRAPIRVMSAYQLSKSDSRPTTTQDYIKRIFNSCNSPAARPSYNLKDILGTEYITPSEAERALHNYVATILSTCTPANPVIVRKRMLKLVPHVNTIPTRKVRIPDGSIEENGATIFLFELESDANWYTTTLKLTIHLSQMLASLRNRVRLGSQPIDSISGFYIPYKSVQCVVEVQVKWSDKDLKFLESHSNVEKNDIETRLKAIYLENKRYWNDYSEPMPSMTVFHYPVTPSYLSANFGDEAIQIESGHSVVVAVPNFVYKNPMNDPEARRLSDLMLFPPEPDFRIAFPLPDACRVGRHTWFKMNQYLPPPSDSVIKKKRVWYTRSLVKVVNILHSKGIAHLDIRSDNICVCNDGNLALIDLDRSCDLDDDAVIYQDMYASGSEIKQDWTAENLDWFQVGVLLNGKFPDYAEHPFILKLKNDGEI